MLAEVPPIVVDAGTIAAALTAVLAAAGALAKWGPVASRIRNYRSGRDHAQHEAHRNIVRGVLDEHVTPRLDGLTATVTSLDDRLTAHMADEMHRFNKTDRRIEEIVGQLEDHIAERAAHGLPRPGGRL